VPAASARPAAHSSETESKKGDSAFDWNLERPAKPKSDSSVMKAAANMPEDEGVTTIRLMAGSEPVAGEQTQHGEIPPQKSTSTSGWKKAKK
jgi:hypothetical protein